MKESARILIVEDEPSIRDMISLALSTKGFDVRAAESVKEAKLQIANQIPDLILLDWMLPDVSGITFAKELKANDQTKNIRIIMLTARAEEESKIKGLETGADDYITKPFSPRELIARIGAILRRGITVMPDGVMEIGLLQLNTLTHTLMIANNRVDLSPTEYKLLHFFMSHPNRTYNREQLLNHVWGGEQDVSDRTVDTHVRRLRKELEPYGCDDYIKTIHGHGYQFIGKKT